MEEKRTVLLIDDSVTVHRVVELSIDSDRFHIVKVFSSEDAIPKLNDGKYNFILLDYKLENINLKLFTDTIRNYQPEARIILLVGGFEPFSIEDLVKSGADDYLIKPFDSQSLNGKLSTFSANEEMLLYTSTAEEEPAEAEESLEPSEAEAEESAAEEEPAEAEESLEPSEAEAEEAAAEEEPAEAEEAFILSEVDMEAVFNSMFEDDFEEEEKTSETNSEEAPISDHTANINEETVETFKTDTDENIALEDPTTLFETSEEPTVTVENGIVEAVKPIAAEYKPIERAEDSNFFTLNISKQEIAAMLGRSIDKRILESALKEVLAKNMEEIVRGVVPAMAEKYIKAEIERLKNDE